ncbi:hypothetical protein FF38_05029 [Lucilia cuprina]|uniref:Uncharacterized protein n=1 Tax=Lucilia cuprina TaxID=7375 RepID=A0A0L0BY37_LUCCU|nr:hypothetical protein FF38_05029 [Lucilia cuprina]
MVSKFVKELNPKISPKDLDIIKEAARNGDVTPVMTVYESHITKPITSIVTGKLVTTALIQVQKAKVDLEVALSGIDRLLQSQQLVFGLVAAIPALLVVFQIFSSVKHRFISKSLVKTKNWKIKVYDELSNIDKILHESQEQLTTTDIGALYTEIYLIDELLKSVDESKFEHFHEILHRILRTALDTLTRSQTLMELDRLYLRFRL